MSSGQSSSGCENIEKLLSVPKLPTNTGSAQADAFVNLVNE